MLAVQSFLTKGGDLAKLNELYGITIVEHPTDPLVILNYSQIDSPKMDPIVMECRGLCLEKGTWDIVARSFTRFFNMGEALEQTSMFDWNKFTVTEKCDGSLMTMYCYGNKWRVNTRGSFAQGEIATGTGMTWEEVFWSTGINPRSSIVTHDNSYVFELCSPYNKIVRTYDRPLLFLLGMFHNSTGYDYGNAVLDVYAHGMRVGRPQKLDLKTAKEVVYFLENHPDPTYEGVVVRDWTNLRMKIKNPRYVALHHLRGEGENRFSPKYLIPFILAGETDELVTYFPEVEPNIRAFSAQVEELRKQLMETWEAAKGIENQKEFALYIRPRTELAALLFMARQGGRDPAELFRENPDLILKRLK